MKCKRVIAAAALICAALSYGQEIKPVQLKSPDMTRKTTLMNALSKRSSSRAFSPKMISVQELSDLLWAANGINRADKGGRTAPSAINAQDIDVYVITAEGAYLYNAAKNLLELVAAGDFRGQIASQEFVAAAPVNLFLVSDLSRFSRGDDAGKMSYAALDAGTVSQNISLFCAAAGLATVPRAMIDVQKMAQILKLKDSQKVILNHPVGYLK